MTRAEAWVGLTAALVVSLGSLAALGPVGGPAPAPAAAPLAVPDAEVPAPTRAPAPSRAGAPVPAPVLPVVQRGDGSPQVVAGSSPPRGTGPLRRFTVAVEGGLGVDAVGFARSVEATLADRRSWGAGGRASFQRVDTGPVAFRVVLASPDTTDRMCRPLRTGGIFSCANGDVAVLNARRWLRGADSYTGDTSSYRQYVVNHEVGHTLGHGHARCPAAGRPAPVMVQQTKGLGGCARNPWPYPSAG